jgi:hypothetical protein
MQRFGRYQRKNGLVLDVVNVSSLTLSVISPPSIDALRKVHSTTSSAMENYREVPGEGVMSVTGLLGLCGVVGTAGTAVVTGDFWPAIEIGRSGKPCG